MILALIDTGEAAGYVVLTADRKRIHYPYWSKAYRYKHESACPNLDVVVVRISRPNRQ